MEPSAFAAIGDPTRRQILEWLDGGGSATATELADRLPITRQAVTKHLRELEVAGLVVSSKQGRENRYEALPSGLEPVQVWLETRAAAWDQRLDRLRKRSIDDQRTTS
ncbi:MAG: ArsR/SmtB family transcription factor [Acidimicrobiia bacterium]